ncbi:MAG: GNAT family N-acetyltransferase [Lachnospiraceae bacterium]|nr:GNAT family N-acetyltransferase [Lachnospiraceae bacterium]
MFVIRQAHLQHMKDLAVIQTNSWKDSFSQILSPKTIKQYTDINTCMKLLESIYKSQKGIFYIALSDNSPCGEAFWCTGAEIAESAEIISFHVAKDFWGTGLGKVFMQKIINDIRIQKKHSIYLWVFQENIRARKFYEKAGFYTDNCIRKSKLDNVPEIRYIYSITNTSLHN